jgi:hypothetical protein
VLGDLTFAQIGALFALAPLYGGGAILIREIVRRTGRGWPTFLLLGLAYAFLEEALLTQSLFNPNYLHLRLIDYGFLPALGTALPWAIFVLAIHVCWSLAVPVGLVESAFPDRRTEPWLKLPGLAVVCLFFGAGALFVSRFSLSQTPFRASSLQILLSSLLIMFAIAAAFFAFRRGEESGTDGGQEPASLIILGIGTFLRGSAFLLANSLGRANLPWQVTASVEAVIIAVLIAFFAWANRSRAWSSAHSWSAAAGGLLCYVWLGYTVERGLHGAGHALEHSIFVVAALIVAAWAGRRTFGRRPATSDQPMISPA